MLANTTTNGSSHNFFFSHFAEDTNTSIAMVIGGIATSYTPIPRASYSHRRRWPQRRPIAFPCAVVSVIVRTAPMLPQDLRTIPSLPFAPHEKD